jgi:hypothetical protein
VPEPREVGERTGRVLDPERRDEAQVEHRPEGRRAGLEQGLERELALGHHLLVVLSGW